MRAVLCAVALLTISTATRADRLIKSSHVIYREATDDYEFRVRFSNINEFPDLSFGFKIYGPPIDIERNWIKTLGGVNLSVHGDEPAELWKYTFSPTGTVGSETVASVTPSIAGDTASIVFSRDDLARVGNDMPDYNVELLFRYHLSGSSGVRYTEPDYEQRHSYQYPITLAVAKLPLVQLNVPEPSTMWLAAAATPLLLPQFRRRLFRR